MGGVKEKNKELFSFSFLRNQIYSQRQDFTGKKF